MNKRCNLEASYQFLLGKCRYFATSWQLCCMKRGHLSFHCRLLTFLQPSDQHKHSPPSVISKKPEAKMVLNQTPYPNEMLWLYIRCTCWDVKLFGIDGFMGTKSLCVWSSAAAKEKYILSNDCEVWMDMCWRAFSSVQLVMVEFYCYA